MILNYKRHFPFNGKPTHFHAKIIAGRYPNSIYRCKPKIHSIREDPHNRWKTGMLIHHAYGARTKKYECFDESPCKSTQTIEIKEMVMTSSYHCYVYEESVQFGKRSEKFYKIFKVIVDGRALTSDEIDLLAKNDGFDSTHDFFRWFSKNYKGKIIHWTDFKY